MLIAPVCRVFWCGLFLGALAGGIGEARAQAGLLPPSDEFASSATWNQWSRVRATEQWGAEPALLWDIATTTPGALTLVPETVTWYQDWTGPLMYRLVSGDFALTSHVRATARDGVSVPQADFSLAGVMLRRPRAITPVTWAPGGENYVFLSIGHGATVPATFQYEVKTTANSVSTLLLSPAPGPEATLQFARLGDYCIALRREGAGPWQVHHRYTRSDLPDTLQAGLVGYTDWNKAQHFDPWVHNQTVIVPGVADPRPDVPFAPDLRATFDYARFARVTVPAELAGLDLSNPAVVSDAQLLAFLGEAVNIPGPTLGVAGGTPRGRDLIASPNPSAGGTSLRFALERGARGELAVYDVRGARIRTLQAGEFAAGEHVLSWDGRSDDNRPVERGLYFVRFAANNVRRTARVLWVGAR